MIPNTAPSTSVVDNVLQFVSPANDRGQIDLNDIVGVIAQPGPQQRYGVLYLERSSDDSDELSRHLKQTVISCLPEELSSLVVEIPDFLRQRQPVQIVVSTRAGLGTAKTILHQIVEPFLTYLGIDHQIHETQSAQTVIELSQSQFLERACAGIAQTIILLSGDGGLLDIVDVFYKSHRSLRTAPDIALIPCGTGNAMANSIGFRGGPASALTGLLRGKSSPVPIFAATFSPGSQLVVDEGHGRAPLDGQLNAPFRTIYGAVVASWGLHAALVADSDTSEYRRFGSERFKMAAQELLHPSDGSEPHRFQGRITLSTIDKQSGALQERTMEESEHMYVLATLVPRLERDFLISPDSVPMDGSLRFLYFSPLPGEDAMRLMTLAYQGGQHVREGIVTYIEVEELRIDFEENQEKWRRVCIDGKIVAVQQGGWMKLSKEPRQLLNVLKI